MSADPSEPVHPDLPEWLAAWDAEEAPEPEAAARWIERLRSDERLRRQFADEIHLAGLTRAAQAGEPRWLRIEERLGLGEPEPGPDDSSGLDRLEERVMGRLGASLSPRHRLRRRATSPWLAAAAGLVIGLCGASVVWALAHPKAVATASRLFTLVDGSFENGEGGIASGLPTTFGVWSGDRSEIVADGAADPAEGRGVLRFLGAEREPTLPDHGAASCDVYQLVDLRSWRPEGTAAESMLELSVRFRDGRAAAGEKVKFLARIHVFAGSPVALAAEWPITQKEALASASGGFDSHGGASDAWIPVRTKVLLPTQADFAVVHLLVHKPETPKGTEASFRNQFADDVCLTLKTQPTLPVRLEPR
jgi:hypothetical protein